MAMYSLFAYEGIQILPKCSDVASKSHPSISLGKILKDWPARINKVIVYIKLRFAEYM
jgi:hypothetical protein